MSTLSTLGGLGATVVKGHPSAADDAGRVMRYLVNMPSRLSRLALALFPTVLAACGGTPRAATVPANQTAATAGAAPSVRSIDWLNRTYGSGYKVENGVFEYAFDENGDQVAGDYQSEDPDAYVERGSFTVSPPEFGDVTGDGIEDAIILSVENGGGTGRFSGINVYTMRDGREVVLGEIPGGDRGDGGILDVTLEGQVVKVERMMSQDGDGACCPSKIQHERWRWDGKAFVEDVSARVLADFAE